MPEECPYHARLQADITDVQTTVHRIDERLGEGDVRLAKLEVEGGIVKKIVFGAVGLLLLGAGGALLALIL